MMPQPPTQLPPQTAALLDSLPFNPVAYTYKDAPPRPANAPPALPLLVCKEHEEIVCPRCGTDFTEMNQLGMVMSLISPGMVPPPPNVQFPNTAESIKNVRDKGNVSNAVFVASPFSSLLQRRNNSKQGSIRKRRSCTHSRWSCR
jgi:hypothetical protein